MGVFVISSNNKMTFHDACIFFFPATPSIFQYAHYQLYDFQAMSLCRAVSKAKGRCAISK